MNYQLHHGDCLEVMATLEDNSITAIVTDPPYGLGETPDIAELMQQWITEGRADTKAGFMNKSWDVVPGPVYWREMYRIAKPGAYLLAMCGTRTVDLMSIAIRFGGWVKFDEISYHMGVGLPNLVDWCYSQGFPKSHNISVAIDKAAGAEREVVGRNQYADRRPNPMNGTAYNYNAQGYDISANLDITAPATPEAATWAGYGSALKPAHEIILCFRKPVDGTYANNALKWGTGGLNIDACRVGTEQIKVNRHVGYNSNSLVESTAGKWAGESSIHSGRFPANIIWDGSDAIKAEFDKGTSDRTRKPTSGGGFSSPKRGDGWGLKNERHPTHQPIDNGGSAARFFTVCPPDVPRLVYHSKASSSERNEGLDGMPAHSVHRYGPGIGEGLNPDALAVEQNHHPTVKPLSLTRWMCRLLRQPANNLILDPFGGSGTTGVAALLEGCDTIIIEREADYIPIIRARLEHFEAEANMKPVTVKGKATDFDNLPMFAEVQP